MWYVVSESGDLQSGASHEGSCDADNVAVDTDTTTADTAGEKGIEVMASELVTMAIQKAILELQNEV